MALDLASFQFSLVTGEVLDVASLDESHLNELMLIEKASNELPWSEKNFLSSLKSSHVCLGVRESGRLVAYAILSVVVDQAELLLLVVAKPHWRRGIASTLMQVLINKLEDHCSSFFLEVRASNLSAINLYEMLGFNQVGVRESYYPVLDTQGRRKGAEDALIYALEFIALPD